jgi:hypothetical protein
MPDPREMLVLWMAAFVCIMGALGILVLFVAIRAGRK